MGFEKTHKKIFKKAKSNNSVNIAIWNLLKGKLG